MNRMTEQSNFQPSDSHPWPAKAIPQHWIEALFAKMSAFYGARFADLWRGTNTMEVQKAWAVELGKLSAAQMKAGSDNLTAFPKPPSLPEFIEHCKRMRLESAAHTAPKLEHVTRADQKVIDSNLKKIQTIARGTQLKSASRAWAHEMIERGTARNGAPLTVEVLQSCRDVIEGKTF
ncbi:hypothetical protein AWB73_00099 [Caballeronia turbans]|nr:hypothetical protein AWB73_00099 [Caballeronia turbans]